MRSTLPWAGAAALCLGALAAVASADDPSPLDLPVNPPAAPAPSAPPGLVPAQREPQLHQIVYVIDCSCSMAGGGEAYLDAAGERQVGSHLDRAKAAVIAKIARLRANTFFNVVAYSRGTWRWVAPPYRLAPATPQCRGDAIAWVRQLKVRGPTRATGLAVVLALKLLEPDLGDGLVQVYSDGLPDWPSKAPKWHRDLIRTQNQVPFCVDACGIDASGDFRRFCLDVARENHGRLWDVP